MKCKFSIVFLLILTLMFQICGCSSEPKKSDDTITVKASYSRSDYSIKSISDKKLMDIYESDNPDDFASELSVAPYFNIMDKMYLESYLYEDGNESDCHWREIRPAKDTQDYCISDYKDGVCINSYCGKKTNVVIPQYIDGKPVLKIGGFLYSDEEYGEYVYMFSPFYGIEVKSITIPSTVREIARSAFRVVPGGREGNKPYLENITVDSNNPYYTSIDGILYTKDKKALLHIPNNYPKETIEIPEGTEAVYCVEGRFGNTKIVKIPDSVISFGEKLKKNGDYDLKNKYASYLDVTRVKKFVVSENNKFYSSKNGTLYNKDKSIKLSYQ